jgi:O-antigen/teichoic acid export membrane protein
VSSTFVMWMWLIAALAAFVVLMYGLRVRPNLGSGWRGLRERHRTGESVSIGTVVTLAASLLVTSMVAAMLTDADVGSMRGASTLLGPLNVVMAFVALALTPALLRRSRPRDLRFCVAVASVTLSAVVVWGVVVLLLPNWVGERLLHESWAGARSVLPFAVLEYAGLAVATAWTLGLKVRRENGMLVRQKLAVAVLMVVGGGVGAIVIGDVRAVSAGLAVAAAAGVLLGWHNLFTSLRRAGRARVEVETPVSL